jgi:hypothetical protein
VTLPNLLLCCRCSRADLRVDAKGWHLLLVPGETFTAGPMHADGTADAVPVMNPLDICPHCAGVLLRVLRQTPDILEDAPCR